MHPNAQDISVVIQGPIVSFGNGDLFHTARLLEQVRTLLPGAQIIVSTWMGSDLADVTADEIIESEDPGGYLFEIGSSKPNNINRMLLSTKRGLDRANRRYILKLRSDMMPTNSDFIKWWARLSKKPKHWPIFNQAVLAYPVYSLLFEDNDGRMPKPYHVSDWAFFGLAEDVKSLFAVPLVEEPAYSRFFDTNTAANFDTAPLVRWKYSPEQYLFYAALRNKYVNIPRFAHKRDYNKDNIIESERAVFSNFVFIDPDQWGLVHDKPEYRKDLHHYDQKCFHGLIQFGTYIRRHWKNVGPLPIALTIVGLGREIRSHLLHKWTRLAG